jgi:hypothetical protein
MMIRRKTITVFFILALTVLTTSCAALRSVAAPVESNPSLSGVEDEAGGGFNLFEIVVGSRGESSIADAPSSSERSAISEESESAIEDAAEEGYGPDHTQLNLRAGSVDDNEQWDDYLLYRIRFAEWGVPIREIDITERHILRVSTDQGLPVLGARISIFNDQGSKVADLMTTSDGQALFFPMASEDPNSQNYDATIEKDGQIADLIIDRELREHEVTLEANSASDPVRLDVHFLIDATGSMSDEIYQLKENMILISECIHDLPSKPDVRFGMTIYRDRGDDFVTQTLDFTPDIEAFIQELSQVEANGGGDYSESLNEGFHDAIHLPEWRIDDTVSLIFLIADAPPHLDYGNDYDYAEEIFEATERGVKIFPVASSGLDDQGEYIFRQLAQISGGKFLFLTYGPQGGPGDETTHHVEDYSVLSLDQLIIRIVEEELANLNGVDGYKQ